MHTIKLSNNNNNKKSRITFGKHDNMYILNGGKKNNCHGFFYLKDKSLHFNSDVYRLAIKYHVINF